LVARDLAAQLPAARNCIASQEVGEPQRASFDYFAKLRFVPIGLAQRTDCEWLLTQGQKDRVPFVNGEWTLVWQGARPNDNVERFRLYRKAEPASL
jgi:hypothetical protein